MARLESRAEGVDGVTVSPGHLQAPLAAGGAQLQAHPRRRGLPRTITGLPQRLACLRQQTIPAAPQLAQQGRLQHPLHRRRAQRLLVRKTDAIGREHPGQGMEQHPRHPEPLGQGTGVLTAGAAVAHQHRCADVMAALDRHAPDRLGHPLQGDGAGALGERLRGERRWRSSDRPWTTLRLRQLGDKRLKTPSRKGPVRGLIAAGTEERRQGSLRQTAQQQVGVGDGEGSAAAVAGRPWIRPGRLGAHLQPAPLKAHHRAAAGGHRMDRQGGGLKLEARHGGFGLEFDARRAAALLCLLHGPIRCAALQVEHIGGGAAHVKTEDRPRRQAGGPGHGHRPGETTGGPGEHRVLGEQLLGGLQHTGRGHHPQPRGRPQGPPHPGEVGLQHRPHGRLHQGGVQARQQPRQTAHPVGEQNRIEAHLLKPAPHRQLVGRINHGMEQGHGATAQPLGPGLAQAGLQRGIAVEGFHFAPIGGQAARHLQHPVGQERWPLHPQGKDVGPVLGSDGGQIGKAPVHEQQHWRHPPLQQGIGRHGGAEPHLLHQTLGKGLPRSQTQHGADGGNGGVGGRVGIPAFTGIRISGFIQSREHEPIGREAPSHQPRAPNNLSSPAPGTPISRPTPRRKHLVHHPRTIGRQAHQIRERASAVDPEAPAASTSLQARWPHAGRGSGCVDWAIIAHTTHRQGTPAWALLRLPLPPQPDSAPATHNAGRGWRRAGSGPAKVPDRA